MPPVSYVLMVLYNYLTVAVSVGKFAWRAFVMVASAVPPMSWVVTDACVKVVFLSGALATDVLAPRCLVAMIQNAILDPLSITSDGCNKH